MNAVLEARNGVSYETPAKEPKERPSTLPTREMVARRAFEIWQRHGCPAGTSFHDWLAAEAELRCSRCAR